VLFVLAAASVAEAFVVRNSAKAAPVAMRISDLIVFIIITLNLKYLEDEYHKS
jgi:hypothetical protein